MKILGIIPARYASTRFPAKALADVLGKSMVQRVYEQAKKSATLTQVLVATDDNRIYDHVKGFGGEVVMTAPHHPSGTDRCFEALKKSAGNVDFIINIQGDEPFINPGQIDLLASVLSPETELATLVKKIDSEEVLFNPNSPKVVLNQKGEALYFSRSPIPYLRGVPEKDWLTTGLFYKHIGIYAYRIDILESITRLTTSSLENAEALEQLRWLENGYKIKVAITEHESFGIDTPEDLEKAIKAAGTTKI